MLFVTLIILFIAVTVLMLVASLQVNTFTKNAENLLKQIEDHIYL